MASLAVQQRPVAGSLLVLLVEDHLDSRELYAFDLRQFGFRVEEADSAAQAIQSVATITPDVIVTDLALPDFNGLKLCQTLRASAPTSSVPIIALTGYADAETARAAREAGCAAVLVKPCVSANLRAEICRVLDVPRKAGREAQAVFDRAHVVIGRGAASKTRSERVQESIARHSNDSPPIEDAWVVKACARVRAEFLEMPGLHLSVEQAARFLGLERSTADQILERLVQDGFLQKNVSGLYRKAA